MRVRCIVLLKLPFQFGTEKDLLVGEISVNNVQILPIKAKTSNFYDSLKVEYLTVIEEDYFPLNPLETLKNTDFKQKVIKKIGLQVNKFVNAYYRQVKDRFNNQVFNGDDFTTYYEMVVLDEEGKSIDHTVLTGDNSVRVIDHELYNNIINDIYQNDKDLVQELLRIATAFLEKGYFDMSIMNLSMALEAFIKTLVFSNGVKVQELEAVKGYVEKFFHIGLKKVIGLSMKENMPEYYDTVRIVTDARNTIAHGGSLNQANGFKEANEDELYDIIRHLTYEVGDIVEWAKEKKKAANIL